MKNKEVRIYCVRIQGQNGTYYWKNTLGLEIEIGDWVIVQNANSYSLGQVIAIVECTEHEVHRFANFNYDNTKDIICLVDIEKIKSEYEGAKTILKETFES